MFGLKFVIYMHASDVNGNLSQSSTKRTTNNYYMILQQEKKTIIKIVDYYCVSMLVIFLQLVSNFVNCVSA